MKSDSLAIEKVTTNFDIDLLSGIEPSGTDCKLPDGVISKVLAYYTGKTKSDYGFGTIVEETRFCKPGSNCYCLKENKPHGPYFYYVYFRNGKRMPKIYLCAKNSKNSFGPICQIILDVQEEKRKAKNGGKPKHSNL